MNISYFIIITFAMNTNEDNGISFISNTLLSELHKHRNERNNMSKEEKEQMIIDARNKALKAKRDSTYLIHIKSLYNKVMNQTSLTDEISIFKVKYHEMINAKKFKKAPLKTPKKYTKDSDTFHSFVEDYVKNLSDESRESIIKKYGEDKAIELLHLWQNKALEMTEEEKEEYFACSTIFSIQSEIAILILKDEIGAHIDWKYE
jgi:hypothetical protein